MDYLVDAGEIIQIRDVSARSAAILALTMLGDRAAFPIEVHLPATGETTVFVRNDEARLVA